MSDSIFNYESISPNSEIIDLNNWENISDEAKLICLLFGGVTIVKDSECEIKQTTNYFLLDNLEIMSDIFDQARILQSKIQDFESKIDDCESVDIPEVLSGNIRDLNNNLFLFLKNESYSQIISIDTFLKNEFSLEDSNIEQLKNYFIYMNRQNKEYQNVLLFEFTMFFFKCEQSPSTAFIHIYRILELLTFNIPLVYTSKANNYIGSFKQLKTFFSNSGQELSFFKNFLKILFKDEKEVLDQDMTFFINCNNLDDIINDLDKIYTLKDSQSKLWDVEIIEHNESAKFTIKFTNLIDLIVNIRNRYFHLNDGSGNPNIKNKNYDMDNVFKQLNFTAINCLAIILLATSKHSFNSYSLFWDNIK